MGADTLSALDAGFLHIEEGGTAHQHIGGVLVLKGRAPSTADLRALVGSRLDQVPRYRQKLAWPPAGLGRPRWVDDRFFDLDHHIRRTENSDPGGQAGLQAIADRFFSIKLDYDKPLWEMLIVPVGAAASAVLHKTHHCLVDGVGGIDVMAVLVDAEKSPDDGDGESSEWSPDDEPSGLSLAADAVVDRVTAPLGAARSAAGAVTSPIESAERAARTAVGAGKSLVSRLDPAPPSHYNRTIGPHRILRWTHVELDRVKDIKATAGVTVNDVVLAVVSGMVRRHLDRLGALPDGGTLTVQVPVSVRAEQDGGNAITNVFCDLPINEPDPVARLRRISGEMDQLKGGSEAMGAQAMIGMMDFAPPVLAAQASRQFVSEEMFNFTVTNVPGPQMPLYFCGRELAEIVPVLPLFPKHAFGVAILSYNGSLCFGLLGERQIMADLDELVDDLSESVDELEEALGQ
ncbi:MAG: wax ester/triacylglycerol synthase family O-acyltransferase [Solirubrobacterales bacterium]